MEAGVWLKRFRALHEQAKRGTIAPGDVATYRANRDELARAMLAAQNATIRAGQAARQQLRAALALQVEIEFGREKVNSVTLDVSSGGMGLLLAKPPMLGDLVKVSVRLPGQKPVTGVARVVDVKVEPGTARAALAWSGLPAEETERLEMAVFDRVLEQIG
jgi:c-di-GMP-binding flagellar brake protein YcgR